MTGERLGSRRSEGRSTFLNAHSRLKLFTGRTDPAGRDEQYERLFLLLLDANQFQPVVQTFAVGMPGQPISLESAFDELVRTIAERNPDFYDYDKGNLVRASK
jgi:hypothetical protein